MEVADLEVTTRERGEDVIRSYIDPRIGDLQVGTLDAEHRSPGGHRGRRT